VLRTIAAFVILAGFTIGLVYAAPSADQLQTVVEELAHPALGGRVVGSEGIDRAAEAIVARFKQAGLKPAGEEDGWFQAFTPAEPEMTDAALLPEGAAWGEMELRNIAGILPGTGEGCVIVGAHYDHLGRNAEGAHFPGADDNASGIAALWAVASELVGEGPRPRDILFIAFSGEEEGLLGSRWYVEHPLCSLEATVAMINLDTIGRIVDRKLFALSTRSAAEFPRALEGVNLGFDFDLVIPEKGPLAGDQVSFIEKGVPALHLFTGPNEDYHRTSDLPEKLDYAGLSEIAAFTAELVRFLADREQPLTFVSKDVEKEKPPASPHGGSARRVSLGTIPDFSDDQGGGVLVSGVLPDSPAEKAGILKGDRVIAVDDEKIATLEDYSIVLKSRKPGDKVRVTLLRDSEEKSVEAVLVERK
jgi:aminopeptidase N